MTPKDWKFIEYSIVESCKWAYEHGHRDGASGKPLNSEQFELSNGDRMKLKSAYAKATKKA